MQLGAPAVAARAHEEIYAYWASRRLRGQRLPSRAQIDPEDLKRHLPTVSLIEAPSFRRAHNDNHRPNDYRLRLAGTKLYDVYNREITGRTLGEIYSSAAAEYWRTELDKVVATGRPNAGMHSLAWRGASHLSILWLRLPLASDGETVDMVLGYDAPLGVHGERDLSGIRAA